MTIEDPNRIRAWQRLADDLTTSGRITGEDVTLLAALGVRHVINLALTEHPEALADEADALAAQGIAYTHIPVPFDAPDDTHFTEFRAALEQGQRPVHVHCIVNYRVSAFLYRYNREVLGMEEAAARALMVEQWEPETSTLPQAPAWVRFIAPG